MYVSVCGTPPGMMGSVIMVAPVCSAIRFGTFSGNCGSRTTIATCSAFIAVTGEALSQTGVTSNTVTTTGGYSGQTVTVSGNTGCEYKQNGGSFTAASGTSSSGDTFQLEVNSSASNYTLTSCQLSIGTTSKTFNVTTIPAAPTGLTPTPGNGQVSIAFTGSTGEATANGYYGTSSNPFSTGTKVTGVSNPWVFSGTNGQLYYFTVTAVDTYGNESAAATQTSSTPYTITIPTINAQTGIALSTTGVTSNTVTTSGGYTGQSVSVSGDTGCQYSKNSGAYTAGSGTSASGDTFTLEVNASASNYTSTSCTLTVGTSTRTFTITTILAPPTMGTATGGNAQISTTYTGGESGAVTYNGYYSTTNYSCANKASMTKVTGISASPWVQTGLSSVTYYLYITAVDSNSNESTCSSEVSATPVGTPVQQGGYSGTLTANTVGAAGNATTGSDHIMQNYSLTASTITQAKIQNYYANAQGAGSSASSWIAFKVWRLSGGVYTLIGNTGHISMQTTAGLQTYTFTGITCQTGDLLGFTTNAGGSGVSPYDGQVDAFNTGSGTWYKKDGDITSGTVNQGDMTAHTTYQNIQIQFWGN